MTPSAGLIIGLPIGAFLMLVGVLFAIGAAIFGMVGERLVGIGVGLVFTLVVGLFTAGMMYPYKTEYHYWLPVHGTVASVSKRLVSDGGDSGGMNERFVVKLQDGRIRSCDDTRCSGLKVGDPIELRCKKAWQWSGTDGWDCNWAGKE